MPLQIHLGLDALKVQRLISHPMPRCVADVGLIRVGKIVRKHFLTAKNEGERDLAMRFHGPRWKHPIVEQIDIERQSAVVANGWIIFPDESHSFNGKLQ